MSLLLLFKSHSSLGLVGVMNQIYGDEIKKRRKRKSDEEAIAANLSEEMNKELTRYSDLEAEIETWQKRINDGIRNERLARAANQALIDARAKQMRLARLILDMQEEEYLLGLLLLQ